MKKQNEIRYIVTDVVSIPVIRVASKTEAYRQATKPGWGTVEWYSAADGYTNPVTRDRSDKTQELACDENNHADLYTKNGGYFGIYPYDEINVKEMPKQAECAAIIHGDSDGFDFWTQDGTIKIFVTYNENGLIDTYRLGYGDEQPEEGETEISFDDLYQQPEGDVQESYRAEIPGTVEYQRKQETAQAGQEAQDPEEDSQQEATSAAAVIAPEAENQKDQPQAQKISAGNQYEGTRQEIGGGAGPPPQEKQEKKEQGVNRHAAV